MTEIISKDLLAERLIEALSCSEELFARVIEEVLGLSITQTEEDEFEYECEEIEL